MEFNEPVNTLDLMNDIKLFNIENLKVGDIIRLHNRNAEIITKIDLEYYDYGGLLHFNHGRNMIFGGNDLPFKTQVKGVNDVSYDVNDLHLKLRPVLEELLTRDNQLKEQINLLLKQREDDRKRIETLESDYKQLLTNMSTITEYMKRTNKLEQTIIKLEEQHVRLEEKMVEFEEGETIILKKQS